MAKPGPLGSAVVLTDTAVGSGTSGDGAAALPPNTATPTIQVPQSSLSGADQLKLVAQEAPQALSSTAAASPGSAPAWARSTNAALKDTAWKVGSLFHNLLPRSGPGSAGDAVTLRARVTVQKKLLVLDLTDLVADSGDDVAELLGQHVSVQLVSTQVDATTGEALVSEDVPILNWITTLDVIVPVNFSFDLEFRVPRSFGAPGAIVVKNRHIHEFLLVSLSVQLPDDKVVHFPASSWVYSTNFNKPGRIFFSNELYLPKDTPKGLRELRQRELQNLRGNGEGERKYNDRIYDYATYNDLGNPDSNLALKRPVLGGSAELPYPRRCRTGRPPTKKDGESESKGAAVAFYYIPRDENFDQVKFSDFAAETVRSAQHSVSAAFRNVAEGDTNQEFDSRADILSLYAPKGTAMTTPSNLIPAKAEPTSPSATKATDPAAFQPLTFIHEYAFPSGPDTSFLTFPLPQLIAVDEQAWSTDIEFARQMLAGLNPLVITLIKEFPIKSTLDGAQFGDPRSAIAAEHLEPGLEGLTVDEAVAQKRLFVQDYHDTFLPYLERINAQGKGAMYAPRTVVFLTSDNILTPLAIELALPPRATGDGGVAKQSRVFTPPGAGKKDWVWELAKAHVASVDCSYHEVVSHFLRTHACIEPFIIATNRQLSALHPVNNVLVPHYKNTMDINAAARKALVNAGGIIEANFTPGRYTMEMSAVVYKLDWRFDEQSLPEDLLKRGMAVRDLAAPHGVRLVIEDYPYAADGLELWGALTDYMREYVEIFYAGDADVAQDAELQSWWHEVRTVGHGDKKDAPGWPSLQTRASLAYTLTTIAWVASCHHAAVNFGQYAYGGYMPNHPSMTRQLIPAPGTPEFARLQRDPERFYLDSISNETQATSVMSTIEILSTHALDEEYLGQRATPHWSDDARVLAAFDRFAQRTRDVEAQIAGRNADARLKNRSGPVHLAYELLVPTSKPGMTGRGVPNSVSI